MTCEITFSAIFKKELKQLLKRHRSIQSDVASLVIELKTNPFMGTNLENGFRKIPMAVSSKGNGKSGGARVITLLIKHIEENTTLQLFYIYDKSDTESISDTKLRKLLATQKK